MEEEDPQPVVKVVITLPPVDDPSQGKMITAFALPVHNPPAPLPAPVPAAIGIAPSSTPPRPSPHSFSLKKAALGFVLTSAVILFLWAFASTEVTFDFLGEEGQREEEEAGSILLKLYRKDPGPGNRGRLLREEDAGIGVAAGDATDVGLLIAKRRKGSMPLAAFDAATNSSVAFRLTGNIFPDGMYYTILSVGNPSKPYFLDVDTGSDLTWIQCNAPCRSCAKGPNPLYKPRKEKLVLPRDSLCTDLQKNLNVQYQSGFQCDYEIEYTDRSSSMGVLVRDKLLLMLADNRMIKPDFVFGCGYDQQGRLLTSPAKTDGILGLSQAKISLLSQLASQNIITNVLGHCISNMENSHGYMFFGSDFVPQWGMTWVPMTSSLKSYQAKFQKISYGEQHMLSKKGNGMNDIIFDTGSTYSYFPSEAYTSLITMLGESLNGVTLDDSDHTLPVCWKAKFPFRSVEDAKGFFKTITLHFANSWLFFARQFTIAPEGYLMINDEGNACLGILDGSRIFGRSVIIIGDNSLRGKLMVYDNVQKKIGWLDSDCTEPQKNMGFYFF